MPASSRTRSSRVPSSRPYGRRSPTASPGPVPMEQSLVSTQSPDLSTPTLDPISPVNPPDCPGLPTYAAYKRIEAGYLLSLSPRKRDKALITQAMFDKIWDVLHQPEACTVETPQFRFWVRKMFTLTQPVWTGGGDGEKDEPGSDAEAEADAEGLRAMGIGDDASPYLVSAVVLHENRPVAIMEQLYELFCYCHLRAGHGGRDKTCAVIREHYSWVPKELTAQFVKACPTCALKRSKHGIVAGETRRKERRRRRTTSEESEASSPMLLWPDTGGPLDPANPEPCGRARRRCAPSRDISPVSSRQAHVANTPPCRKLGQDTWLPPLASALSASNDSLEDHGHPHLIGLGVDIPSAECRLPSVLQPLRLTGPCVPGFSPCSSFTSSTSSSSGNPGSPSARARPYSPLFPIDPVLLSFGYPGHAGDVVDPDHVGPIPMQAQAQGASLTSTPSGVAADIGTDASSAQGPGREGHRWNQDPLDEFDRGPDRGGRPRGQPMSNVSAPTAPSTPAKQFAVPATMMSTSQCGSCVGGYSPAPPYTHDCAKDELERTLPLAIVSSPTPSRSPSTE